MKYGSEMQSVRALQKQRRAAIWVDRLSGMTLKAIGEKYGVGPGRIRSICFKEGRSIISHSKAVDIRLNSPSAPPRAGLMPNAGEA